MRYQFSYKRFMFLILLFVFFTITWFVFKDFIIFKFAFYFRDIGSDSVNNTLPNHFHAINIKKVDGNFTTWSFFKGMGESLPIKWLINPLHIIVTLWRYFAGDNFWLYTYYGFFSYAVLTVIFSFFYFRTINMNKFTAVIFSLLIPFSGYFVVGGTWGHYHLVLKYIFLLFAYEQWLIKDRWIFLPIAVNFLALNLFYLATGVLFLFFYSLVRYYELKQSFSGYVPMVLKMSAISLIGILASLVAIYPQFHIMWNAPRVSGTSRLTEELIKNPENFDAYLRNVTVIMRTFSSDLLGTGTNFRGWYNYLEAPLFYIGLFPLILLPLYPSIFNKKERILYSALLALVVIITFVPIIRHAFNFFIGNYYKGAVDFFIPFFILLIAAKVFNKITEQRKKINSLHLIIGVGILLILLHFPYFKDFRIIDFNLKIVITLFIIAYAVVLNWIKDTEILFFSILILVSVELVYLTGISIKKRDKYPFEQIKKDIAGYNDGTFEALKYIYKIDTSAFYRIEKDYSSGNSMHSSLNDPMVQGYYGTTRYSSFAQKYYVSFLQAVGLIKQGSEAQTRWITGVRGVPLLMSFASVKYFLAKDLNTKLRFGGYDSIGIVKNILILKNKYAVPFGFSTDKYLKESEFDSLSFFKKQVALLMAVILPNNILKFELKHLDTTKIPNIKEFNFNIYDSLINNLTTESFHITDFKNRRIKGYIYLKHPKFLLFTIPYDRGWRIEVDNHLASYQLADYGFIALPLSPGKHQIILEYFPPYYHLFKWLSYVGIVLFFLLLGYRYLKCKKV